MNPLSNWKTLATLGLVAAAYLPTLGRLVEVWTDNPQYSHGFLIPLFVVYLCRKRYAAAERPVGNPAPVSGFMALAVAACARAVAGMIEFLWLDGMSLVVSLVGVTLVAGGWRMLRWMWPGLMFLIFAVPAPYAVEVALGQELQRFATVCSTFVLQTLGQPAVSQGNLIHIGLAEPLNVAEACSGLRMLITFVAFSVGAVFVLEMSRLEKALTLASAVPIALACNVARISATGLAHIAFGQESGVAHFLHDWYGFLMMILGLALLAGELWLLNRLLIKPAAAR